MSDIFCHVPKNVTGMTTIFVTLSKETFLMLHDTPGIRNFSRTGYLQINRYHSMC